MPKTKISEFSATPANNTDIDSINIAEGCAPSGINDAIRELMAQLKDFQTGAVGDSFNGPVGTSTAAAGAFTTLAASSTVTLSGGTANGVAFLNGSKVVTSGSALTFDGTNLGIGGTAAVPLDVYANSSALNLRLRGRSADSIGQMEFWNNAGSTRYGYLSSESTAITLAAGTSVPLVFVANAAEQMRLTSTGLGIGTSSPVSLKSAITLQVFGNAKLGDANDRGLLSLGDISSTGANCGIWRGAAGAYGSAGNYLSLGGYDGITFTTGNADIASQTERMRLDSSGNLGIGTSSPTNKLDILTGDNTGLSVRSTNYSGSFGPSGLGGMALTAAGAYPLFFYISGATRATLDSSGNLLVSGTSTTPATSDVIGISLRAGGNDSQFTGDGGPAVSFNRKGTDGGVVTLRRAGTQVGSISVTSVATIYNTTSDYRLKNITGALAGYKERLMSLQPKQGTWKIDGSEFRGFLAHDFAVPYRASVTGEKDAVDSEGKPIMQAMQASSSEVMADLVAMVNELITENASLKARLDAANL